MAGGTQMPPSDSTGDREAVRPTGTVVCGLFGMACCDLWM